MNLVRILLLAALSTTLQAEQLVPELAPLATKYKSDTAALTEQQAAANTKAAQEYQAALDAAERSATESQNTKLMAAIEQEKEAFKSAKDAAKPNPDLPGSLQAIRKNYLVVTSRISTDFAPRFQKLDSDYLRALAFLENRAKGNTELRSEIAAEKAPLLNRSSLGTLADRLVNTTWRWWHLETLTFHADGKARWSNSDHDTFTWKQTRANKIEGISEKGIVYSITFSPNVTTGKILEEKAERNTELLKRE